MKNMLPLSICLLLGNRNLMDLLKKSPLIRLAIHTYRSGCNTLEKILGWEKCLGVVTELRMAIGAGSDELIAEG